MHESARKPKGDTAVAAAEALRRAGGALPVSRLADVLDPGAIADEPVERAVRRRSDLFLLVDRPDGPWRDDEWPAPDRSAYERSLARREQMVVLLEGGRDAAPMLLRETLLSMWAEAPADDALRRELTRTAASPAPTASAAPLRTQSG